MKILTVAIQKGGTGKTTTAAALAQAAAHKGLKVLAIDLDPQCNLSFALGAQRTEEGGTSYNLLTGLPAVQLIQETAQGVDVIPGDVDLSTVTSGTGSARRLQQALEPIKEDYDLIVIDTPSTVGELQYNALMAADGLVIPLEADTYNLQGLYQTIDTARKIQEANDRLRIVGVVITKFDGRSIIAKQLQKNAINSAAREGVPYLGTIRLGVAVKEAAALQQNLYQYARRSKPAADYMDVFNYITENKYLHDAQEV